MTTARANMHAPAVFTRAVLIAGAVAITAGLLQDPTRTWSNLLVDGFYVLSIALGGMLFLAIQHLSGAAWSAGMRRVGEAMMGALPVAAAMMLLVFVGRRSLYPWATAARPHEVGAALSSLYFSPAFVFSRMAGVLALWMIFAWALRRHSVRADTSSDPVHHRRTIRQSAIFVPFFAATFSLASVDWLLTIDPGWSSTMYAVYVFAGVLLQAVAGVTLIVVLLHERGALRDVVNASHLHDLGKLLLAFSTFWAYIWLSQYLLVWYGNLPEEVGYYVARTDRGWLAFFLVNLAVNWLIPFCVLLPRASKRNPSTLKWVAVVVLLGRWLDLYLLVTPQTLKAPAMGLTELAIAAAYAGIAWHAMSVALARRPLVVANDPHLVECRHHHQ